MLQIIKNKQPYTHTNIYTLQIFPYLIFITENRIRRILTNCHVYIKLSNEMEAINKNNADWYQLGSV